MSKNCIKCVKRRRTGGDLLCDECRAEPPLTPAEQSVVDASWQKFKALIGQKLCSNCLHGGSAQMSGVRCMHPHWDDIGEPKDSPYRVIDPEFAEECSDYNHNNQAVPPQDGTSA